VRRAVAGSAIPPAASGRPARLWSAYSEGFAQDPGGRSIACGRLHRSRPRRPDRVSSAPPSPMATDPWHCPVPVHCRQIRRPARRAAAPYSTQTAVDRADMPHRRRRNSTRERHPVVAAPRPGPVLSDPAGTPGAQLPVRPAIRHRLDRVLLHVRRETDTRRPGSAGIRTCRPLPWWRTAAGHCTRSRRRPGCACVAASSGRAITRSTGGSGACSSASMPSDRTRPECATTVARYPLQ
jgi:hypothetical protein